MKNILITGSNGFIARELIRRLKEYPSYNLLEMTRERLDVTKSDEVDKFFDMYHIDYVIHTAIGGGRRNTIDSPDVFYNNLIMFENLIKHRGKYECMITFGSGAERDRTKNIMELSETDFEIHNNEIPQDYYGFSKYLINEKIRFINDNILNLRIFNVFGELEAENRMIKNNVNNYIKGNDIIIHQDKWMDFFGVNDLFKVIKYIIDMGYKTIPGKSFNMCYQKKHRLSDVANIINNLSEHKSKIVIEKDGYSPSYCGYGSKLNLMDSLELDGLEKSIKEVYNKWN